MFRDSPSHDSRSSRSWAVVSDLTRRRHSSPSSSKSRIISPRADGSSGVGRWRLRSSTVTCCRSHHSHIYVCSQTSRGEGVASEKLQFHLSSGTRCAARTMLPTKPAVMTSNTSSSLCSRSMSGLISKLHPQSSSCTATKFRCATGPRRLALPTPRAVPDR